MSIFDNLIIKEIPLDENMYYHAFLQKNLVSIYNEGIKSLYSQRKESNGGWNGKYYISVCKKYSGNKSAYNFLIHHGYNMLIIDSKIHTIKTNEGISKIIDASRFMDSSIPIRMSEYNDEYQVFSKIRAEFIKGIRLNESCNIEKIKKLFLYMINNNIDLPCFDYSYESEGIIREVSKTKVLKLK